MVEIDRRGAIFPRWKICLFDQAQRRLGCSCVHPNGDRDLRLKPSPRRWRHGEAWELGATHHEIRLGAGLEIGWEVAEASSFGRKLLERNKQAASPTLLEGLEQSHSPYSAALDRDVIEDSFSLIWFSAPKLEASVTLRSRRSRQESQRRARTRLRFSGARNARSGWMARRASGLSGDRPPPARDAWG